MQYHPPTGQQTSRYPSLLASARCLKQSEAGPCPFVCPYPGLTVAEHADPFLAVLGGTRGLLSLSPFPLLASLPAWALRQSASARAVGVPNLDPSWDEWLLASFSRTQIQACSILTSVTQVCPLPCHFQNLPLPALEELAQVRLRGIRTMTTPTGHSLHCHTPYQSGSGLWFRYLEPSWKAHNRKPASHPHQNPTC